MGVIIDAVLDKIFGKVPDNTAVTTVDQRTASRKSEIEAIEGAKGQQLLISSVGSKRKFKPNVASVPGKDGAPTAKQIQQFAVSANLSGGIQGGLTKLQVDEIRNRPFTKTELADIEALRTRRNKSRGTSKFFLKDDPEEVIFKKREQEAIAKGTFAPGSFVDGKLFGNPNFNPAGIRKGQGKLTEGQKRTLDRVRKGIDPRNMSSAERAEIERNKIRNAKIAKERDARGARIQAGLNKSGLTQKQAVLAKGGALRGGNVLNARALAKLQEQGLI